MEPVTVAASALLAAIDWKKIFKDLATDAARRGSKSLVERFRSDEREKAAKQAIRLFVEEFLNELEDKTPLSSAIPGYHDQLRLLVEHAAPDITACVQPETKDVDLGPVERMWRGLNLDPLPADFDWTLVAKSYARDVRKLIKSDPALREQLNTALLELHTELLEASNATLARIAPLDPGFDLSGYRDYLRKKCALLQLSAMHSSTYERRVTLWSVFVPQSARESAPVRDLPREVLRRLRQEGEIKKEFDDAETKQRREIYQSIPTSPILDVLSRNQLAVVLGDPGSGKTSLLKFLVMRWATRESESAEPLPIWIDLKEYARDRCGFLKYVESGFTTFGLDSAKVEMRLRKGEAALYLDGLDEVFDAPTRGLVIEEIVAFAARYAQTPVMVTSRIIGYEPDRLGNAGFIHATLEDFDNAQVSEFLHKWHDAAEDDTKERSRLQDQLERALRDSRSVRELAGNPLLLTMMAILNLNQDLPRDRVELYAQASRVLLHEWDASRSLPVDTFARQEKEELLRELAGRMQQGEDGLAGNLIDRARLVDLFRGFLKSLDVPDPHGTATLLVRQLTERNFILCYAGAERFSFVHRTFLEYFCASWFVNLFQTKQTLTLDQLRDDVFGAHWRDESWHEVLRLITGMVGEKQAEELILFLMEQDGTEEKLANLMLAAGCLSEVRNRPAIQKTGERLRQKFVEHVIRYHPSHYADPLNMDAEAVPTRRKAIALIALVWRSENTRAWLTLAAQADYDEIVRMAAVQELSHGWRDHPETLPILKDRIFDEDSRVRRVAVQELSQGWMDDPEAVPTFKSLARDAYQPEATLAIQALARHWKDDPETLLILKHRIRRGKHAFPAAFQELVRGWKDDPDTLTWLKETGCSHEAPSVRTSALQEVARGWKEDPGTVTWLKERVRFDDAAEVRNAALYEFALGWKKDPEILTWLKERARADENDGTRIGVALALAHGWKDDPDTLPIVKELAFSSKDLDERNAAGLALIREWKDDPDTLPTLQERVRSSENWQIRQRSVRELARGWRNDAETPAILKEVARTDAHYQVRLWAAQELARGWKEDPDTLSIVKDLLRSDENYYPRLMLLEELVHGWKDDPDTPNILKESARFDENDQVRKRARAELLRGWKDDPAAVRLLYLLKEDREPTRL